MQLNLLSVRNSHHGYIDHVLYYRTCGLLVYVCVSSCYCIYLQFILLGYSGYWRVEKVKRSSGEDSDVYDYIPITLE